MPKSKKLISVMISLVLVLLIAPIVSAQFSPSIFAVDQDVVDGIVRVTRVTSNGPGWIVIHADDDGKPGPVIGQMAVPNGISANVKVEVDAASVTPVLHPMLHVDEGTVGTYEFPGADAPATVNDQIVMVAINVGEVADSLASVAEKNGLTTLLAAVDAAGVAGNLSKGGPYTVFAPTDEAFAALPDGELDALLADPDTLSAILLYHVVPGMTPSDAITQSMDVDTVQGEALAIEVSDGAVSVGGAGLVTTDLAAYNGVIHVIDQVLMPPSMMEPAEDAAVEETAVATETVSTAEVVAPDALDIVDTAAAAGGFDTLLAAVDAADLTDLLKGEGPYTVFAPTDEAFAAVPQETLDELLADPAGQLTQLLLYHVLPAEVMAASVSDGMEAETAQGGTVTFTVVDGKPMINDANIIATDIVASNGVIHVIDKVIMPPASAETEGDATEVMTETTAMTDTAEMAVTEAMTETAAMTDTAEMAVTEVTTETTAMTDTAEMAVTVAMTETEVMTETAPVEVMDIVDTAVAAGSFNTLVAAVQAAGLEDALRTEGAYTVFAPTDEAFAKIPQEMLDQLLADPTGDLTQILLFHVLPKAVTSAELSDGLEETTLQGNPVKFTMADGVAMINDANIIMTDIVAGNGVIHVIDSVILPPTAVETTPETTPETPGEATPESPAELPTTGGSFSSPLLTLAVAALSMVILAAGALVTRRRQV